MIDIALVAAYLLIVLVFGLLIGARTSSFEGYAVAGRAYGPLVIFATLSASFIGGGFSIGNAEKVFLFGIANIVALWGFSAKEILVARYLAPRMARFETAVSVGDIMAMNFGRTGRLVGGVFSVLLCCGIVGAQISAIGLIFNVFLGLTVSVGVAVGCGIVILYTTIGGMRAVVLTDIVQFVVLSVGIPLVLVFGIIHVGGIDAIVDAVPPDRWTLPGPAFSWIGLAALFLAFLLGETLVPPYIQRLLIGRDPVAVARGTLMAGLFSIPFFVVSGLIGLVALTLDPAMPAHLALPQVVTTVMPPILKGFVIAGIISVVMSSADSFLNAAAVTFVNDLIRPLHSKPLAQKDTLLLARLVTLVVGVGAVVFALATESLLDILLLAYTYWAPVMVVPLAATILGVRRTATTFVLAAVAGAGTAFVWNLLLGKPGDVEGFVVGALLNGVVFMLARGRPERAEHPIAPL
ncbi:MAG: sodium:solute symporter family protein [Pseudomonadota bacterium]